ncbi:MAG TPA: tRNA (adenosine(37)-N6)-threonylcarbamoyltransferase complex dimerization subunit type 1 TsaB [Spirochaetota bacterium]|nr:tRNA (adenosine(37)-N6)-threonylcarbamoyltransferase complex dimerization subunit type 1 TsaB [Spirochaetota bacterium]HPL19132.1 tRNA (adenosine(37)-N6)-threonylcarbamoyltransferase complex dimerization subunit type 1 TsaB [Spirochaetota bacterium]HQF10261.1 tRNA (adenosine(37)-N6)-threonylcarbamoyltransferase complex dimerization subunit type 1 TsaB [Spirochaetota bacterium]HQH99139.1 tRNA (adenosine(37)-N6)-threonylcarbamoyltransferase complex dimerization subunit type 1 TsaB [Spirochaetot
MNILVIDTASPLEIIAASRGDAAVETSIAVNTSHSVTILDTIDRCLAGLGLAAGDINCLGVGVGPGSFTGIRIAVSTARMMAQVLGIPLVGIPTHLLYAASVDGETGENVMVAFDAKKGRVFGALYRKSGSPLAPREIIPPGDYGIERLLGGVDISRKTRLIGNGTEKYREALLTLERGVFEKNFVPSGETMCRLVNEAYRADPSRFKDYNRVVPCYARKSDAEVAKELREKM